MFRELGGLVRDRGLDLREGRAAASELAPWLLPRLNFLLQQLHEHHTIEDAHYFPAFQRAEPRLIRGFELLEGDHVALDRMLAEFAEAGRFLLAPPEDAQAQAENLLDVTDRLLAGLLRHLDDEEDLVMPLLIERGDA